MLRQALLSLLAASVVSAARIPVAEVDIEKRDIDLKVLGTTFEVKISGHVSKDSHGSKDAQVLESLGNIVLTGGSPIDSDVDLLWCHCDKTEDRYYCYGCTSTPSKLDGPTASGEVSGSTTTNDINLEYCRCYKTEDRYYCYGCNFKLDGTESSTTSTEASDLTTTDEVNAEYCHCDKTEDRYYCYGCRSTPNDLQALTASLGCRTRCRIYEDRIDCDDCAFAPNQLKASVSDVASLENPKCVKRGKKTCCDLGKWGWKCYIINNTLGQGDRCHKRRRGHCVDKSSIDEVETLNTEAFDQPDCVKRGRRTCRNLGKWGWKCYILESSNAQSPFIALSADDDMSLSSEPSEGINQCWRQRGRLCCRRAGGVQCFAATEDSMDSQTFDSCWAWQGGRCCRDRNGNTYCYSAIESDMASVHTENVDSCWAWQGGRCCRDRNGNTYCYSALENTPSVQDDVNETNCVRFEGGATCCLESGSGNSPKCYKDQQVGAAKDECFKRGRKTCCWDGVDSWICTLQDVSAMECFTAPNPITKKPENCCPNKNGGYVCQSTLEFEKTKPKCYKRLDQICCPGPSGKYVCKKFGPPSSGTSDAGSDPTDPKCQKVWGKTCCPLHGGKWYCYSSEASSTDAEVNPAKPRCYKRLNQICCPGFHGRYVCKKTPSALESSEDIEMELTVGEDIVLAEFGTGNDEVAITSGNIVVTISPEGEMKDGKAKLVGKKIDGSDIYLEGNISGQRVLA